MAKYGFNATSKACGCRECLEFRIEYLHVSKLVDEREGQPSTASFLEAAAIQLYLAWQANQELHLTSRAPISGREHAEDRQIQACGTDQHLHLSADRPQLTRDNVEAIRIALFGSGQPHTTTTLAPGRIRSDSLEVCYHRGTIDNGGNGTRAPPRAKHGRTRSTSCTVVRTDETLDVAGLKPDDHDEYDGKFMVCDHCHAHGLPCNETSVCDQCRLYEQACVHRWCRNSKNSKDGCGNPDCRYVHQDWILDDCNEPQWIILHGKLQPYMEKGRMPARSIKRLRKKTNPAAASTTMNLSNDRQQQGLADLHAGVESGISTLENLSLVCGCQNLQPPHHFLPVQDPEPAQEPKLAQDPGGINPPPVLDWEDCEVPLKWCPVQACTKHCNTWAELSSHTRSAHGLRFFMHCAKKSDGHGFGLQLYDREDLRGHGSSAHNCVCDDCWYMSREW